MDDLKNEITAYENQLSQIQLAISASPEGPDKENLKTLESDIKELIKLTKETLQDSNKNDNPLDAEYDLFKAELEQLDEASNSKEELSVKEIDTALEDLHNDLKSLEGVKCQAPYKYQWSNDVTYHNALVCNVDRSSEITRSDDIKVRVMFTNPTHKEMLPCPFYLDGECRFSDDKCRFSHGEVVLFNSLKEYREPNFSELTMGSKVFAKQEDNLWHRAVVTLIDGVTCKVKFESNSKEEEVHLQNVLPLDDLDDDDDDDSSDSSSDEEEEERQYYEALRLNEEEMVRRVLTSPPASALGEWEKYTKGFGSKIMAKMGYVHGSGLGSKGDGRVEPVPAVILPAGKSLDHCMMLRENAGGDQDLFKAERKMKKLQKKHEAMLNKQYEKEKEKTDVFTFLNKKLGQSTSSKLKSNVQKNLKKETTKGLNVTSLQLAEEVKKTEREIKSLNESLARHSGDSPTFALLKEKLGDRQAKLNQLQASERKVMNEQQQRRDQKKLSIF